MGFTWQEYKRGLPFPPLEDLPNAGIEPMSLALAGEFFTTEPPGKPSKWAGEIQTIRMLEGQLLPGKAMDIIIE